MASMTQLALERRVIDPHLDAAAVDCTGVEMTRKSYYFTKRSGQRMKHFGKVAVLIDPSTQFALSMKVGRGPSPDDQWVKPLILHALQLITMTWLLADAGFDSEALHRWLLVQGILGLIPPRRGRPHLDPSRAKTGFWRRLLERRWPMLSAIYNQRWQVESFFSRLKTRLGSVLTARHSQAINREIALRVITMNLLILLDNQ